MLHKFVWAMIVFVIVVLLAFMFVFLKGVEHIKTYGLKSVVEQIWEGENK